MISRRIDEDIKDYLDEKIENAQMYGKDYIELRFGESSKYKEKMIGFEDIKLIMRRQGRDDYATPVGAKIIKDAVVYFYPDNLKRCWGYMLDTPNNRKILAAQYKLRQVIISDNKIDKEIKALCKKLGYPTEMVVIDHTFDNYLKKSKKSEETIDKDAKIEKLEARLAELEKEKEPKEDDKKE